MINLDSINLIGEKRNVIIYSLMSREVGLYWTHLICVLHLSTLLAYQVLGHSFCFCCRRSKGTSQLLLLFSHLVVSNFCLTPSTVAHQAPLSMGFPRQEYWSGQPFPSPSNHPDPGIKLRSPALQMNSLLDLWFWNWKVILFSNYIYSQYLKYHWYNPIALNLACL